MQTKTLKKYSENFLNNQNYILGNTEKKKLLSKFFVELFFKNILSFLPIINGIIYIFIGMFIGLSVPFFFLNNNPYVYTGDTTALISFSLSMLLLIILGLSFIIGGIKKIKFLKYKNINDYFILKKGGKINNSIWAFIFAFSPLFIFEGGYEFFILYGPINILILLFLYFYFSKKKLINFGSILFSPIVLVFSGINLIISFINVFLFRGIIGYKFFKKYPIEDVLYKFEYIEKNSADNIFYKIDAK